MMGYSSAFSLWYFSLLLQVQCSPMGQVKPQQDLWLQLYATEPVR